MLLRCIQEYTRTTARIRKAKLCQAFFLKWEANSSSGSSNLWTINKEFGISGMALKSFPPRFKALQSIRGEGKTEASFFSTRGKWGPPLSCRSSITSHKSIKTANNYEFAANRPPGKEWPHKDKWMTTKLEFLQNENRKKKKVFLCSFHRSLSPNYNLPDVGMTGTFALLQQLKSKR